MEALSDKIQSPNVINQKYWIYTVLITIDNKKYKKVFLLKI